MADDDLVYLLRRSAEERAKARNATDDSVMAAHREMADAYDAKTKPARVPRPKLTLHSI